MSASSPVRTAARVSLAAALLFCPHVRAATLTVSAQAAAPTPAVSGANIAHFMPDSNASDWWRHTGLSGARVFLNAAHFNVAGSAPPGDAEVVDEASFLARRAALRSDPLNPAFINWPLVSQRFNTVPSGNNRYVPDHAFGEIRRLGGNALAQVSLSESAFPITGPNDWRGRWVAWRTYYSIAHHLARHHGVTRFSAFNEPNHPDTRIEPEPWLMRLRLASDAAASAVADAKVPGLHPVFTAPVTAGATGSPYTEYGRPAVRTILDTFAAQTQPLFHLYSYQQYNLTPSSFAENLVNTRSLVTADLPAAAPMPRFAITEFNVHTGATFDAMPEHADTLSKAIRLAAISTRLMQAGADELYAFKFGMTAYPATRNYPVQKNALLYVDNDHPPYSYGSITRSGDAYRLFTKAFAPGRSRLVTSLSGTGASDLVAAASIDPADDQLRILTVNESANSVPLSLNLADLKIPPGNIAIIEDVSQWRRGSARWVGEVSGPSLDFGNQPAQTVWLITLPTRPQRIQDGTRQLVLLPAADTTLRDGPLAGTNFGSASTLTARHHPEIPEERSAAIIRFDLPPDWDPDELELAFLSLPVAPINGGAATIHAHLYAMDHTHWSETSATWSNTPALRQNAPLGNQIRHGVVAGAGSFVHILGNLTASGTSYTTRQLDITRHLRGIQSPQAAFLVAQVPRWNVDIHQPTLPSSWDELPPGDSQPDGLRIRSREAATPSSAPATLTVVRKQPQPINFDQWLDLHFPPPSAPESRLPHATPDSSGLPNLVSFALGHKPGFTTTRVPALHRDRSGRWALAFTRNRLATDVQTVVEWSHDLRSWSSDGIVVETLNETETTSWLSASRPDSSAHSRGFFRLAVTRR
jgi:hypothetical protein